MIVDLVIAFFKGQIGTSQRLKFEYSLSVHAPKHMVWHVLRAPEIVYPAAPMTQQVRATLHAVPNRPGHELCSISVGEADYKIMSRIIEEHFEQALQFELVADGTSEGVIVGVDDYFTCTLTTHGKSTKLHLVRELTPTKWYTAVTVPNGLRLGANRIKAAAEQAFALS